MEKNSDTDIALIKNDINYIKSDIGEIKISLRGLPTLFASKEELKDILSRRLKKQDE